MRELRGATVVIAGASSGIGRAAALAFAREGANLVLAAPDRRRLQEVAREIHAGGGEAEAVATDLTDAVAMRRLAERAAGAFGGRIDVWVNNGGMGAVGRFTETPVEAHDLVIATNLLGYIHGAHAVLPYFQRQQSGGVLINTISFGGWVPALDAAAYAASKFGLRGFTQSLRAELSEWPEIHVCDLYPSFIDTPGVQHGGGYTGLDLQPAPPVHAPDKVAEEMVALARNPRDAVTVGAVATLARLGYNMAPAVGRWAMNKFVETYLSQAKGAAQTSGNLFRPMALGDWRSAGIRALTRAGSSGMAVAGALIALEVGLALARGARGSARAP
jgi:short-subunit dehydrogenase